MRIRAFAFGDLETGIWGVAATTGGFAVASFASELSVGDAAGESLLASGGLELRFTPVGVAAEFSPAPAGIGGHGQLCQVQGAVHWAGAERDVACLGLRATVELPVEGGSNARAVAAWLGPEDGFALVAVRPRKARGHDADAVVCALIEDGQTLELEEPRFSSTYDGEGSPMRAGLELWPAGSDSEDDPDQDPKPGEHGADGDDGPRRPVYPRRAAGERAGDGAELRTAVFSARAEPFRWHAHGLDGAGIYLLIAGHR
jgi:hypothetical protein